MAAPRPGTPTFRNLMELRKECAMKIIDKVEDLSQSTSNDDMKKSLEEMHDLAMKILYDKTHDHFVAIASLAALRSKDPYTPVGACIIDTDNRVVGIGYTSMPHIYYDKSNNGGVHEDGEDHDDANETNKDNDEVFPWKEKNGVEIKKNFAIHAAVNAIINRTIPDLHGCTMYLTQHPDEDCAHLIAQSGIKRVIYWHPYSSRGTRDHEKKAMVILLLAEVSIEKYEPKTEVSLTTTNRSYDCVYCHYCHCKYHEYHRIAPHVDLQYCFCRFSSPFPFHGRLYNGFWAFLHCFYSQLVDIQSLTLKKRLQNSTNDAITQSDPKYVITWEEFFMGLAQLERLYSNENDKQPACKVGACIVNEEIKQVLTIGGSSGAQKDKDTVRRLEELIPSCATSINTTKDPYTEHAEYTAIATYKGTQTLRGCTLYVTRMPCRVCAKLVAQTGIKKVVYGEALRDDNARRITEEIFKKCNIISSQMLQEQTLELTKVEPQKGDGTMHWNDNLIVRQCTDQMFDQVDDKYMCTVSKLFPQTSNQALQNIWLTSIEIEVRDDDIPADSIKICTNWQGDPTWESVPKGRGYLQKQHYKNNLRGGTQLICIINQIKDRLHLQQVRDGSITIRANFQQT